ncbi:MAG: ABC transporter substrate-binding protein [Methylovirgula sp.]|uniref:ABC transporter substrate-binding protein n=1 Tax=Methylovirgula sp. TaxID=1978224 RepID=UPI003075F3E4
MSLFLKRLGIWALAGLGFAATNLAATNNARAADLDYGKPGDPIHLVVGYQPYYSEAWSGAVINGLQLWKSHLPAGSTVEFHVGLQGAIIVNAMLAGKASLGYLGDMPAIVGATKRNVADLRILANIGLGHDECNVFFVRSDAPQFADAKAAVGWLNGKTVATPKGSCSDRFAQAVFQKNNVTPSAYLNQSIEVITSGFRVGKIDGAVLWEPTASRLVAEGLARRVASGYNFNEPDGAFLDARADLIKQRPDVIKAWLETELDAELFLADPKNASKVAELLKAQTTGFTQKELWQAVFGAYPAASGGGPIRLTLPFGFSKDALALIAKDTAFLHSVKSIAVEKLADDAILPDYTAEVLKERKLTVPVGVIKGAPETAFR